MKQLTKSDLLTLNKLASILSSDLKFSDITQDIVDIMVDYLGALGGILFLVDQEKNSIYSYTVSHTRLIKLILTKKLARKLRSYSLFLDYKGRQLIKDSVLKKKVCTGSKVQDFICPPVPKKTAFAIQKIANINFCVSLPVIFSGKTIGALWLNFRQKKINPSKLYLLELFSDHAAIALNNALTFNLLKKQNIHLKKLLKMRSEFLDIASHQLRTPISIIKGYAAMLLEPEIKKQKDFEKIVQSIAVKSDKLNRIVSDIIYASELDTGEFKLHQKELKKIPLADYLKEVIKSHKDQALQEEVALNLSKKIDKKIKVLASPHYLEVILDNLIDNALIYTKPGGKVEISIKQKKDTVLIKVKDTGIGVYKKDQKNLFQKFKRAENANSLHTDGSGLGLFIVKEMVKAHPNSKVDFESKVNKGSIFWIELKRA